MKVLGICASPRENGNTEILLDETLKGARAQGAETEKIVLNRQNILPIQEREYGKVTDEGLSVVDDDMKVIYKKIEETDVLVVASPIFFGTLSSQAKIMIDRFQCVWLAKTILKKDLFQKEKKGAFICVEATHREDFFENARSIIKHFFATINVKYKGEVFCPGVDTKGKVLENPEFLKKAYELGSQLAG